MRTQTYRKLKEKNPELLKQKNKIAWDKRWDKIKNNPELLENYKEYKEKNRNKLNEKSKKYHHTIYGRFNHYKSQAKIRKISFSLLLEDFKKRWNKNCFYCDDKIKTIGLDRINNKLGYVEDNIVVCCFSCNRAKGNFSIYKFINKCKKITQNMKLKDY